MWPEGTRIKLLMFNKKEKKIYYKFGVIEKNKIFTRSQKNYSIINFENQKNKEIYSFPYYLLELRDEDIKTGAELLLSLKENNNIKN